MADYLFISICLAIVIGAIVWFAFSKNVWRQ